MSSYGTLSLVKARSASVSACALLVFTFKDSFEQLAIVVHGCPLLFVVTVNTKNNAQALTFDSSILHTTHCELYTKKHVSHIHRPVRAWCSRALLFT